MVLLKSSLLPYDKDHGHENDINCDGKFQKHLPASTLELRILEHWTPDLHWAMRSRENELQYLRVLADTLVTQVLDDTRIGGLWTDDERPRECSITNVSSSPN